MSRKGGPFHIEGPALVSFSTGKTSGYMLRKILDAHDGRLPPDVVVGFANTGKERTESLDFGHEVETRWNVPIVWVERAPGGGHRVVTYETASRNGEPFADLIGQRSYLPNPVTRYCTTELKIRPMRDYLRSLGWQDDEWTNIVGLRADEPNRVARMRGRNAEGRWQTACPLWEADVDRAEVDAFWSRQPFGLDLRPWEGNCDLCFLKGTAKRRRVMEDRPELAAWWIEQEKRVETTAKTAPRFRSDTPSYARLYDVVTRQLKLFPNDADTCGIDDLADCNCTD